MREAFVQDDRLSSVLFLTVEAGRLPPRDWLAALFAKDQLGDADRAALLIGFAPGVAVETGPLVCACRGVRRSRIEAAIAQGASTLDAVGAATGAGTQCGSCRPEITRMLPASETRHAA